jgi:radical SAM superfamily enzyme YgiQ (UPF0313 family)
MCLSSYLKRQGWAVSTLNLNHYGPEKLAEVLRDGSFDVVATGGLFIYYSNIRAVIETTRRESPRARVVLGGPIASADPEFALESLKPDFLVLGEGERPMEGLLRALSGEGEPEAVPGLAFRRGGEFFQTPPAAPIADLDSLPWPDHEGFEFGRALDLNARLLDPTSVSPHPERRIAPVISGRGCAARCTFCYRLTPHYRHRAITDVAAEIRSLKELYRINEVMVWDDLFSSTRKRIEDFCVLMRPLSLVWGCQLRVPVVDASLLKDMKGSGCNFISYGLESASPAVLRSMRKGIDVAKMEEALRLTQEAGITIQGNFIFGDPAETWATARETLGFYRRHRRDFGSSISMTVVVPYPGTVLYRDLRARGRLRNRQRFYETCLDDDGRWPNMTALPDPEFQRLVRKVVPAEVKRCRLFGRVLESRPQGGGLYRFSYECPLCGGRSDGLRLAVSPVFPVSSFRVACARCLQRSYVPRLGLLGWRRSLVFGAQTVLAGAWDAVKASDAFAALRYHPVVDGAWSAYKEKSSARRLGAGGPSFHEQGLAGALRSRLGFFSELVVLLWRRGRGPGPRPR